jgi:hypothetical protein
MGTHHRGGEPAAEERGRKADEAHQHGHAASEEGASTGAHKQKGGEHTGGEHGSKRSKPAHE